MAKAAKKKETEEIKSVDVSGLNQLADDMQAKVQAATSVSERQEYVDRLRKLISDLS